MYTIIFDKSAEKDLDKLSLEITRRVIKVISNLADNPRPLGFKKLTAANENLYRIRSGDYRIIYAVADEIKIVNIRRVRHRKDVYRNL